MIYAVSDLHGCFDKFIKLLKKINFSDNDMLYILGDIVDRGDDGIKILQYIMDKTNIIPLMGNHDFMACLSLEKFAMPGDMYENDNEYEMYRMWLSDGGSVTYEAFCNLSDGEKHRVLSYMKLLKRHREVSVNGRNFFLSHTIPSKEKMLDFENTNLFDFIFGEPEYEKQYFDDKFIVTGHTPTGFIDPKYIGRIYKGNSHIVIDCGAVFGNPLGCICLDTLEEFYVE